MIEIQHSGRTFPALGRDRFGTTIWPIEEFLARVKLKPSVSERIAKLNPNGIPEGEAPRGYHPKHSASFHHDVVSKGKIISQYGRAAWGRVPRSEIRKFGKRAYVNYTFVCDKIA